MYDDNGIQATNFNIVGEASNVGCCDAVVVNTAGLLLLLFRVSAHRHAHVFSPLIFQGVHAYAHFVVRRQPDIFICVYPVDTILSL